MICPKCGKYNIYAQEYCTKCGYDLHFFKCGSEQKQRRIIWD